jgi:hypothetical protein
VGNKKIILPLIVVSIVVVAFFFINSISSVSTATFITIIEKGHSENNKESWIIAINPSAPKEIQEEIKIYVKEPMVWNLIEKNETYFVNFIKKGNDKRILNHIANSGDNSLQYSN